ncbi:winged helix-turn-helix transcriptional regulator [Agromyces seonyuensis]|uniref:Transcriptional regulator n=1 Tax=Agromyces seonyuensis TaxID=2662446 RepID=A0A6I4NYT2_9MICO|nr:transcriptional regulator [Agromyces seonyuensis]
MPRSAGTRSLGQRSGLARAVELVGERWALLVVRELLVGPRRYTDLKRGLAKAPTNILSDRLVQLQEAGLVRRVPVARSGLAYELTDRGRALEDAVLALERFGLAELGAPGDEDAVVTHDGLITSLRAAFRPGAAGSSAVRFLVRSGEVAVEASVADGTLDLVAVGNQALPAPLRVGAPAAAERSAVLEGDPAALLVGDRAAALAAGRIRIDDPAALAAFAACFAVDAVGAGDVVDGVA